MFPLAGFMFFCVLARLTNWIAKLVSFVSLWFTPVRMGRVSKQPSRDVSQTSEAMVLATFEGFVPGLGSNCWYNWAMTCIQSYCSCQGQCLSTMCGDPTLWPTFSLAVPAEPLGTTPCCTLPRDKGDTFQADAQKALSRCHGKVGTFSTMCGDLTWWPTFVLCEFAHTVSTIYLQLRNFVMCR